jgi:hypothetical protein
MGTIMDGIGMWVHDHFEWLVLIGIAMTWLQTYLLGKCVLTFWRQIGARLDQLSGQK